MNELLTIIREKQPILLKIANNIDSLIQNDEKVILDFDYLERAKNVLTIAETEYNQFTKELNDLSIHDSEKFEEIDDITYTYYMQISNLLDVVNGLLDFQMQITDISVILYNKILKK
jgi:hypothetical protein